MDMNRRIPLIGSAIVTVTVFLFAVFEAIDLTICSFFVCFILPIGFVMMTAGFHNESGSDRKVAADTGLIFAAVYCVFIMLVYFSQLTTAKNEELTGQAAQMLVFSRYGLIFNYDMLGYGMMALSTFFTGLSIKPESGAGKWLKALMMIHGVFFLSCAFMPMTGVFLKMSSGGSGSGIGGRLALIAWCVYFLPIGILSFLHFRKSGI